MAFVVLLYLFHFICCCFIHAEFTCFTDENNIITYANNPTKEVKLPTVRLIQGYYPSQYAMQYAAYLFLKEKVGLNVTFYPMNDPNALSIFAANGSMVPAYPSFYFAWLAQNRYDLLLEIWDVMEDIANAQSYYRNHTVKYGGVNGVWSESGWFVPKYIYETHPNWISPIYMVSDPNIHQQYISAATLNSSIDWIAYAANLSSTYTFDTPSYDKPTIFACCDYYALTLFSSKIVRGILNGTWNLVTLGGEAKLVEFMLDLYSKQLPFVIAHYSPHPSFFRVFNEDTREIMSFERVHLPRNPSNSVWDDCFISGECAFPITALRKIANPKLASTFPELLDFLDQFLMNANDVNEIAGTQVEITSSDDSIYYNATKDLSEHEIWQYAVCEWMQSKDVTSWYIGIIRYECFDGASITQCVVEKDESTSMILLILGGVVGVITMIVMIYKTMVLCTEFQKQFGAKSDDSAQVSIVKKEKRRLLISILTDIVSFAVSTADVLTDLLSTTSIIFEYRDNSETYSKAFVILYFALSVIVFFVAAIHIFVTIKNIIFSLTELKRGKMVLNDIQSDDEYFPKLNNRNIDRELTQEIDKLLVKKQLLLRRINHQSVAIFVGLFEDLPFLILNLYGILIAAKRQNNSLNLWFIGSLVCNCLSLGYKTCVFKEFFGNLEQKNEIKESLTNLYNSSSKTETKQKFKKAKESRRQSVIGFANKIINGRKKSCGNLAFNTVGIADIEE